MILLCCASELGLPEDLSAIEVILYYYYYYIVTDLRVGKLYAYVCVRACVLACVHACVYACIQVNINL